MASKKCTIAIDTWKLPHFEEVLREAGYSYGISHMPSIEITYLSLEADPEALLPITEKAQKAAVMSRLH